MEPKPIDRWLGCVGMAVGIAFSLLPKTPSVVIFCLVLMFVLLIHPVWNFWWIEKSLNRRIFAGIFLIAILGFLGVIVWPAPPVGRYFP
jgi:hypothetical protein